MGEVDSSQGGGSKKHKKKGAKKMSTKIDMTPMVDLAFLLITFFMLTTTFNKPKVMEVNMPDKTKDNEKVKVKESATVTLILAKNNKLFYYQGLEDPKVFESDYSDEGIRKILVKKKKEIAASLNSKGEREKMIVIIKPTKDSNFKNVVDILDEMTIIGAEIYAIVDITDTDLKLIGELPSDEPQASLN